MSESQACPEGVPIAGVRLERLTEFDTPQLGTPGFEAYSRSLDGRSVGYRLAKRIFDILFAIIVLVVCLALWPVTIVILAATVISTHGTPFYSQERIGQYGRPLRILKLRTMVADSDDVEKHLSSEQLGQWRRERKIDDDPRITPFGEFCRKTSIDELPQILHLLTGKMSLVGPRPITAEELDWFGPDMALYLSKPQGITGWWQSTLRNSANFESGERQSLELFYVTNASIKLDFRVFTHTFKAVVRKTGR